MSRIEPLVIVPRQPSALVHIGLHLAPERAEADDVVEVLDHGDARAAARPRRSRDSRGAWSCSPPRRAARGPAPAWSRSWRSRPSAAGRGTGSAGAAPCSRSRGARAPRPRAGCRRSACRSSAGIRTGLAMACHGFPLKSLRRRVRRRLGPNTAISGGLCARRKAGWGSSMRKIAISLVISIVFSIPAWSQTTPQPSQGGRARAGEADRGGRRPSAALPRSPNRRCRPSTRAPTSASARRC